MISARFRPSNWLVRLTDQGLFIKFRSYLNDHFPAQGFTVVFIAHAEIRSARFILQKQDVPDRDNGGPTTMTKTQKLVELELATETKELADALTRERAHAFDGKNLGKISARFHHLPVRLAAPDRLQIEWNVVPNAQTLLERAESPYVDSTDDRNQQRFCPSRRAQLARNKKLCLLELAESGDKIGAIAMARRLYAYDLATAKDFVEGLAGKPTTGRQSR